ncbi:hypothetical protein Pst134EB_001516 [Puccinia striiformis f. sp. tritici]|nr:hypothetical protein Pst134EB_001516 [Puccinia striiformis f. sp. tritici]
MRVTRVNTRRFNGRCCIVLVVLNHQQPFHKRGVHIYFPWGPGFPASGRVRRLAGTSVHHSDQVPPPTPRATRLPIKATDDKRPMDNRLDESIRTFNSDESIDQMGSE